MSAQTFTKKALYTYKNKDGKEFKITLPSKYHYLIKDMDETFRLYSDRSEIGKLVLASLEKRRDGVDENGKPKNGFYMSSKSKEVGFLSRVYGANAMFTLMNRYGIDMSAEQKAQMKSDLNDIMQDIRAHKDHYTLAPVLDQDTNYELFVDEGNDYVGAMTWSLSLFCQARVAERNGVFSFTEEEHDELFRRIKDIIKFFVKNVIGTCENPLGWGYANNCKEPSLFFTYSVVEAFADFDDNVLTGGALGRDHDLISFIDTAESGSDCYTQLYQDICFKIGDRAWEIYKDVLKSDFFSDNFSESFKIVTKDEILNSSRSSVLFNTLYVIFILFYSYTNGRHADTDGEEIVDSMTLALQLIQNFYDELCAIGKESIVDRHILAFDQQHEWVDDFGKILNEENIQASPFLPMLVKANNLIAYYILMFPQKKMGELFDMMLIAKMDDEWLWDKRKYDILSTERYLESIADFFEYYDKFERSYAERSINNVKLKKDLKAELTPVIYDDVRSKLEDAHKKNVEKVKRTMSKNYPIEVAINSRIENMIKERSLELLNDSIEKIIKYNHESKARKNELKDSFDAGETRLYDNLGKLMMSYFAEDVRIKAQSANEMDEKLLSDSVQADMQKFMTAFVEFIAYNNAKLPEEKKLSIADIFKIITNKN